MHNTTWLRLYVMARQYFMGPSRTPFPRNTMTAAYWTAPTHVNDCLRQTASTETVWGGPKIRDLPMFLRVLGLCSELQFLYFRVSKCPGFRHQCTICLRFYGKEWEKKTHWELNWHTFIRFDEHERSEVRWVLNSKLSIQKHCWYAVLPPQNMK